ncbi:MAG: glycosyl hydrolase [Mucilaginibacter sp.]
MNYLKIAMVILPLSLTACNKTLTDGNPNLNLNLKQDNLMSKGNSNSNLPPGQMLTISKVEDIGMPKVQLYPDSVYTSYNLKDNAFTHLPSGYEDQIVSFRLPKGYMAVFAENSDGTGESVCYVAITGAINANLPERLRNKVSYIRYMPVNNPDKQGTASLSDAAVQAFKTQWFYGWSLNRSSLQNQQFVPMTFGKGAATDANVKYLVDRNDVDHLLSFNEPDNATQSNIPNIDTAVARYKIMQKSGLRSGAPATTQGQVFAAGSWLSRFMAKAAEQKARIDFIPLHWYDWGNQTNNKASDSLTAQFIFTRFKNYVQKVHDTYPAQAIWITEYNANPNRHSATVHEYFMKLSTDWMNSTPWIERYAYFFPATVPGVNADNSLTNVGKYWISLTSGKAFQANIVSDDTVLNPE